MHIPGINRSFFYAAPDRDAGGQRCVSACVAAHKNSDEIAQVRFVGTDGNSLQKSAFPVPSLHAQTSFHCMDSVDVSILSDGFRNNNHAGLFACLPDHSFNGVFSPFDATARKLIIIHI